MTSETDNSSPAGQEQKIALEQYRNILGYLQYENTMYWTRAGFMLVAQAALLSPLARLLPLSPSKVDWGFVAVTIGLGTFGLVLCYLWLQVIGGVLWWIDRWHELLVKIEPAAYGDTKVFRGAVDRTEQHPTRIPTKPIVRAVVRLFVVVWILVVVAGVGGAISIIWHHQQLQQTDKAAAIQSGRFQVVQMGGKAQLLDTATGRIVPENDPEFGKELTK